MMGYLDFAIAGSSVRKNSWGVCLYGIKASGYMAGSYGGFGEMSLIPGPWERSGNKGLD